MKRITLTYKEKKAIGKYAFDVAKAKREKPRIDDEPPWHKTYEGYLGEKAVAKYYGLPYSVEVYHGRGDDGYDILYEGIRIGVKSTRVQRNPHLLVKSDEKINSDVYCLVKIHPKKEYADIMGWMEASVLKARPLRIISQKTGYLNHIAAAHELRPIEELVPWQKGYVLAS